MSDTSLDTFVLTYVVDSGKAEKDLERLQSKIKGVGSNSEKSANDVSFFDRALKDTKDSVGGLSGTLDGALGKLAKLAPTALAATAALSAIAYTMKAVNAAMAEYSAQRDIAFKAGTGVQQVEQFQRNVSAASKGRVDAVSARDIYSKVAEIGASAYADPMQNNREARLLRSAGGRVNGDDGRIASVDQNIEQIAQAFAKLDQSTAQAKGALLGFTQDQVNGLRALGAASAQAKQMTDAEVSSHAQATEAALKLQGAQAEVSEAFRRTGNAVADMAMGPLADFEQHIARIAQKLPGAIEALGGKLDWLDRFVANVQGSLDGKTPGMGLKEAAEKADADQKKAAEKAREEQKKQNAQTRSEVAQTNRDINLFSQAVATFAGTVDQNRALAAWSGELGRSSGLGSKDGLNLGDGPRGRAPTEDAKARGSITGEQPTGGNAQPGVSRGIRNNNPGNLESGPFTKALGAIGSDGRFATFKTMADGIAAHERLIQNYRKDGFDTIKKIISKYAPSSENDTVGYYKSVAKEVGIDPDAKITDDKMPALLAAMRKRESGYRGENVAPRLQPQGDDYTPSAVQLYAQNPNAAPVYRDFEPTGLAFRKNDGKGIGRQHDQAIASADELAGAIPGATRAQILQGGISRGDIRYAESNLYAGHVTAMLQADEKLKAPGLTPAQRQELFDQRGTAAARVRDDRNFFGDFTQRAPEGPRTSLTIGQMPITIQGQDFTPDHVSRVMSNALKQTVNSFASDKKL